MHKLLHAEIMSDIDDRRDCWRGYLSGLQRAFYADAFATDADHDLWQSLADHDDTLSQDRDKEYRDGLRAK